MHEERIIRESRLKNYLHWITRVINKDLIYSKLVFFLQMLSFGSILFFLPLEYPNFHNIITVQFSNFTINLLHPIPIHNIDLFLYTSDFLIIIISFFTLHRWKNQLFTGNAQYLVLFLVLLILTVISSHTTMSNGFKLKLFSLFLMTALFSFIHYMLEENTKAKIHFLFIVLLGLSLFECFIGTIQYFTQAPAGLRAFEPFSLFTSTFAVPTKHLWLIDNIFSITRNNECIARAFGTLTHTNVYAGFLFFTSFISFYFFYIAKNKWIERLFGSIIFFQFFSICLSFSRAAILAYVIGSALWFFFLFLKKMKDFKNTDKLKKMALLLGATFLICFILFYEQFLHRGGIINYNSFVEQASDVPRWHALQAALKTIQDHPFFGVGLENSHNFMYFSAITIGLTDPCIILPHNIYLLIASETGIIGLSFFLLFIISILKKALENLNLLTLTLFCTCIGLLIIGNFDFYLWRFPSGLLMFFITAGFLSALSDHSKQRPDQNISI